MKLSALFDGEVHMMTPGEDFATKNVQVLSHFEASDDDEILGTWESETLIPIFQDASGSSKGNTLPGFDAQQGWGSFALVMNALCRCLGVDREQYQHNHYTPAGVYSHSEFSFRLKLSSEDHWQGGRL